MLKVMQDNKMLKVDLIDKTDTDRPLNKKFTWNVTAYRESSLDIQLTFEEPLFISDQEPDKVQITFV